MTSNMKIPALPDWLAVGNTGDQPRILALDLATRFGWAFGIPGVKPISGSGYFTHNLRAKPADLGTNHPRLFANVQRFFELVAEEWEPTHVVWEQPIPPHSMPRGASSNDTFIVLHGIPANMVGTFFRYGVREYHSPTVHQVRYYFLGRKSKGREKDKGDVWNKSCALDWIAREDRGVDHDRSDALCVWAWAEFVIAPKKAHHIDDISIRAKNRGERLF